MVLTKNERLSFTFTMFKQKLPETNCNNDQNSFGSKRTVGPFNHTT